MGKFLRIGIDSRAVTQAINSIASAIAPTKLTSVALKKAKQKVKRGYDVKWMQQSRGLSSIVAAKKTKNGKIETSFTDPKMASRVEEAWAIWEAKEKKRREKEEAKRKLERGDYSGLSKWQQLKAETGFKTGFGHFTGSTYRAIDYKLTNFQSGTSTGEISVYGVWPNPHPSMFRTGVASSYLPSDAASTSSSYDIGAYWGDSDDEDDDVRLGYGTYHDPTKDEYEQGTHKKSKTYDTDSDGYIRVNQSGAEVKFAGANQRPFKIHARPHRSIRYNSRQGKKSEGIDFMYLSEPEADETFNDVIRYIGNNLG